MRLPLIAALITVASWSSSALAAEVGEIPLRGYGVVRWTQPATGATSATGAASGPHVHRFTLASPLLAARFASKVLADYELTPGNRIRPGPGCDLIELAGGGFIAPLALAGSREVIVVTADDERGLTAIAKQPWLRRSDLHHPDWLDKWDRHCLGMWQGIGDYAVDDRNPTLDGFYRWFGEHGLAVQINRGNSSLDLTVNSNQTDYLRAFFNRYEVRYQQIEWLVNQHDLYNRNPFLAAVPDPTIATRSHYYGERLLAGNPLRAVQNRNSWNWLKPTLGDDQQMALIDPDGEIGPFAFDRWGQHGPVVQREFVRFLREVRQLDLDAVSRRYTGKAGAFRRWEDVPLADWRTFYGFTPQATDLAGEWRFMRDDGKSGLASGWADPAYNDSDWVRLHYPGDPLVFGLPKASGPLWMRRTIAVPTGMAKSLLTVALLSEKPAQVFVNGTLVGTLAPRVHTAQSIGQFDIGPATHGRAQVTVALRLASGDVPLGPVFITDRVMEDFPTSDPLLNARRFDHLEFTDWAIAQTMGTTLATLRSLDADRPIKIHAYDSSAWGWKVLAQYGGYSHHTGTGPGWMWTEPKQYGAARALQDSAEPGGPMANLRDLKGLWGAQVFMGKNAHDYFINLQSITREPAMRAFFEAKMPAIRVMGRANVDLSPIAVIRGHLNGTYLGEFGHWETWRYGVNAERGGEMLPFLDEVRIREGNLGNYRVIIDEGTNGWDAAMTAALRAYVEAGGTLVLNAQSGRHDFVTRDAQPAATLAGSTIGEPVGAKAGNVVTFTEAGLPGLPADAKVWEREHESLHQVIPGAGATVAASWADGTPALVRRPLGKGSVWLCGAGTYPKEFTLALADRFGPNIWATSTGTDLLRTCASNNGCEELVMVRGLGGKPVTVTWHLDFVPTAVYDPATGAAIPATITPAATGSTVTATLSIDDWDSTWLAVRRSDPDGEFRHWFQRQTEIWSGTAAGVKPADVPLFRHLDLNHDWTLARTATWAEATALTADDGGRLKPAPMILWDAPGTPAGGPCGLYRTEFTLPTGWDHDTLVLSLRGQVHDSPLHGFAGKHAIRLNGSEIWTGGKTDWLRLDVSRQVKPGRNRLEIIHEGTGLMLGITLERSVVPDSTIDLAGTWRSVEGLDHEIARTLPGAWKGIFVYRDLVIPADHRDQEVWLLTDSTHPFAIINGRLRYWDAGNGSTSAPLPGLMLNITPDIRWGESNRIVLGTQAMMGGWQLSQQSCKSVTLGFYAPGRWSGSPNRAALSADELAALTRDLRTVQPYPVVQVPLVRSATTDEQPDPTFIAPVPALDLVFGGAQPVSDRAPGALPLILHGDAEAVSEAAGRIHAIALHADATRRSSIEIPRERLRPLFAGGKTTLHAWIKPIANDRADGALFNWGSWYAGWGIDDDACRATVPGGRLDAEAVVRQRRWQALTLVNDGTAATLYVDGRPAASATWPAAITGIDAQGFIGSDNHQRGFLNARIGAFAIYREALPAATIRQLYLHERTGFATVPGAPEDDRFHLAINADGARDSSAVPATITLGSGVTVGAESGRPQLTFDGAHSWLLPLDHQRSKLFCSPFTLVSELRLAPGATGVILRRHHMLCLFVDRGGDLVLDANIGRANQACRFAGALKDAGWHRITLAYDGQRVSLQIDDRPAEVRDYEASAFPMRSDFPISFFADNTRGPDQKAPTVGNLACTVRELRVIEGYAP